MSIPSVACIVLLAFSFTPSTASPAGATTPDSVEALLRAGKVREAQQQAEALLASEEAWHGSNAVETGRALILVVRARVAGGAARATDRALIERALAIAEARTGPDSLAVADVLDVSGRHSNALGDVRGARAAWERSLRIRKARPGPPSAEAGTTEGLLAAALASMGEDSLAAAAYQRAIATIEAALGPEDPALAPPLTGYASMLSGRADYAGSLRLHERALAVVVKGRGPGHPNVAVAKNNMADVSWRNGDLVRARQLILEAIEVAERSLGPSHPSLASLRTTLGQILTDTGEHDEARRQLEQAIEIREAASGPEDAALGPSLDALGRLQSRMGDDQAARATLERGLSITRKASGGDNFPTGFTMLVLASTLDRLMELAEAQRLYEEALTLWTRLRGAQSLYAGVASRGLGNVLVRQGQVGAARPHYERALANFVALLPEHHTNVAWTRNQYAGALAALGEQAQALDIALRGEESARDYARMVARGMPESDAIRFSRQCPPALDVALSLEGALKTPDGARRTFDAVIRSRSIVLDEMAARARATALADDPSVRELAEALTRARERLATLVARDPAGIRPDRYRRLVEEARTAKVEAERALAAKSSTFARDLAREGIGLREVAGALPKGSALVAYLLHDRFAFAPAASDSGRTHVWWASRTPSLAAFVLRAGAEAPEIVPLGEVAVIERVVGDWHAKASRAGLANQPASRVAERSVWTAGVALRERIWDPLAARLAGAELVFVVPDGPLHLVNFAALPAPGGEERFLVERTPTMHFLSSERDLVPAQFPASSGSGLLALGGVTFGGAPGSGAPPAKRTAECAGLAGLEFGPLPGTLREAEEVARLWRGSASRSPIVELHEAAATEQALKEKAPGNQVLHLATHGFFIGGACRPALRGSRGVGVQAVGPAQPGQTPPPAAADEVAPLLLSGLALAGANRRDSTTSDAQDGILTAEEITSLSLHGVEWAVLSACDTGVGEIVAGEGVFGLRRAFQLAGAATLISSLWSVDDEATREWMTALYGARLKKKLDTASSMRAASREILAKRRAAGASTHPFYWAAFTASGEWR